MFSTRTIALIGALVTGSATAAHAQETDMSTPPPAAAPSGPDEAFHKGTLGFAFPFTLVTNLVGTGAQVPTVDAVYFLSDKAAVDLIAGLSLRHFDRLNGAAPPVSETVTVFGFALGAGYRMYSSKNNLRSFIEPQLVLSWPDTATSSTFTINAGAAMGLERNLTPWFSISGAVGGSLNFTNSFKDIQLATSANLAANLYWH
jgi:hypothetical protein